MRLFLDDVRNPPSDERTIVRNVRQAIFVLSTIPNIDTISLDHDLGSNKSTGYDVLLWIEREVVKNPDFMCPLILIHTANPVARKKMWAAVEKIYQITER